MSKIKLNLKDFKHVKSDDDSTVLKHKLGHELTLAHKSLSKDAQEQLKALCDGGRVYMAEGGDAPPRVPAPHGTGTEDPKDNYKKASQGAMRQQKIPSASEAWQRVKNQFKAEGGEVQNYADGGMAEMSPEEAAYRANERMQPSEVLPAVGKSIVNTILPSEEVLPNNPEESRLSAIQALYNQNIMKAGGSEADLFGPGGTAPKNPVNPQIMMASMNSPDVQKLAAVDQEQQSEIAKNPVAAQQQMEHEQAQSQNFADQAGGIAPSSLDPGAAEPTGQKQFIDTSTPATPMEQMQRGANRGLQAAQEIFNAGVMKAKGDQEAAANDMQAREEAQRVYQEQYNKLEQERQDHMHDLMNAQIDPNAYWKDHSKVAAGIGMILAGFNPTSNPNAAVNFLKFQMEQNLKAQEANLNTKNNLLKATLQHFPNIEQARNMARMLQNDALSAQLRMSAAKAAIPAAKAAALQAASEIDRSTAQQMGAFSKQQSASSLLQAISQDPKNGQRYIQALSKIDPKMAADAAERFVPNAGLVNDKEDAKYLKMIEERKTNIRNNVDKTLALIKKSGTYEMLGPHNDTLNLLSEQIATDMAKLMDPTSVARPSEVEQVKRNLIEAGLSKRNETAQKIMRSFYETVQDRASQAYKVRGIKPPQDPGLQDKSVQSPRAALEWAKANPKDPRAKEILRRLNQ